MEQKQLTDSVQFVKSKIKEVPDVAIILGSGLGSLADELDDSVLINCQNIPHYPVSTVPDHAGIWVFGRLKSANILALKGRVHTYEGYSARRVTYPIRLIAKLGIKRLIVTNAAGGVNPEFKPGDLMLIKDHINFMFDNPLIGDNEVKAKKRFVDMCGAYDKKYFNAAKQISAKLDIPLKSGVLLTLRGPTYETASEVKMVRILGADAATMSTIPEVIAARQMDMRVLGVSCITNMATGLTREKLSHDEVQQTANRIKHSFVLLMKTILTEIGSW